MNTGRKCRAFVLGIAVLVFGHGAQAQAQDAAAGYPDRSIRLVVPYSAGGIADLLARIVAPRLSDSLGQPVVIDNRPGAGGHIGGELVANAPADGYTLVLATIAHNGAAKLFRSLRYDPTIHLQPVILVAESPSVLLVNDTVPAKNLSELLALARSSPGKLSYASAGNGSAMHMAAELFKHMTGIDYVHVPYKGGAPAMTDLLGGQVNMLFESVGTAHQHLKSGKLRPLAVTSTTRNPSLPDVPTVAEAGVPGFAAVPWYTISTARGVPPAIVRKLNAALNEVIRAPALAARWDALGVLPLGGSLEEAVDRNAIENQRWSKVIDAAGLRVD